MNRTPLIKLENVHFSYGSKPILEGLSFEICKGEILAIMGGSGCGKTTALRLIGGQNHPQQGHVEITGQNLNQVNTKKLYELRKQMGVLFQFGALFTDLSVLENIAFPLREHTKLSNELITDIALMKLNAVGLSEIASFMPNQISGGQARRVALARAIALDPQIMLYDEPFAGLDPITMDGIAKLIRDLTDAFQTATVLVSHDVDETFAIADKVIILNKGHILAKGTPQEIKNNSDINVQNFIQGISEGQEIGLQNTKLLAQVFGLKI